MPGDKEQERVLQPEKNASYLSILVLKDIVEDLESMLRERFEYLNIKMEVKCIASRRLYQLTIKTDDSFTVSRSKKIVESMLPNSRVVIESIGGIPYEDASDRDEGTNAMPGQA